MEYFLKKLRKIFFYSTFMTVISLFCFTTVYAESGYRVCVVTNDTIFINPETNLVRGLGRGLVVKVAKENKDNTCGKKIAFMQQNYGLAYTGYKSKYKFVMQQCEAFSEVIGLDKADICKSMEVNKIYKYSSKYGYPYGVSNPGLVFWHN